MTAVNRTEAKQYRKAKEAERKKKQHKLRAWEIDSDDDDDDDDGEDDEVVATLSGMTQRARIR